MISANTQSILVGRDEKLSKRWGIGAGVFLLASLGFFALVKAIGYPTIHLTLWWEGYAVLLVLLISVQAFSNGGVALSWALAFGAVVGLILNYGGIGVTGSGPGLLELAGLAVIGGLLTAAIFGTLGFVIGTTTRRLVT